MIEELVSIIMPSYNTAGCIAESINSVISQTYSNWELIIVDDASTDNTDEVVSKIKDERIRYFKNETNEGAAISRNRALCEAKGKWVAFLDSDDIWKPEKIEKQIKFMHQHDYHFSYTNYEEIDEEGRLVKVMVTGPKRITKRGMLNYCWPGCLTVMYDKEYIGLIQIPDIKKNNDYAMWLKICAKVECYLLDESLAYYRRGRNGSISNHGYIKLVKWHYLLFRECGNSVAISIYRTVLNVFFGLYKKIRYVKRNI